MVLTTASRVGALADRITEELFTERGGRRRIANRLELKFGRSVATEVAGGGWGKEAVSLMIFQILLSHTQPCIIP